MKLTKDIFYFSLALILFMCYTLIMKKINKKLFEQKENELLVKIKFGILTIKEAGKVLDNYAKSLGM